MNANRRFFTWIVALMAPSLAVVLAIHLAASTWERVRTKPVTRSLRVTGSAKQRIISDLIEWQADIATENADRTASYRTLHKHVEAATQYLHEQGIPADAVRVSAVSSTQRIETEYITVGDQRIQRRIPKGWSTRQSISVRSGDIATVERVSREITQLLERGIPVSSGAPRYHYTKLGKLKIDMLARAATNARERAARIVRAAGGDGLGKLLAADMGVINVNPANSTATSWEGNNDKTSYEKDIITITHLTFELP
ncbi:MAG: SIMPL domain-containing protein [Proteobacteria bacterium]|nr:SIMPL domain-containing protein [Pseudomonadota bacterium]